MRLKTALTTVLSFLFIFLASGQTLPKVKIIDIQELPAEQGNETSLGYAGMLGGQHNGVYIVGGGANFPESMPWKGGKKVWSNSIYILKGEKWELSNTKLPIPLGYSASITIDKGILSIGGNNESGITDKVLLLSYDKKSKQINITNYPSLPQPLAFSTAEVFEDFVYVIGGRNTEKSTNTFYRLNLKNPKTWEKLEDFPGNARAVHTSVIQNTGDSKKIFVFGGRDEVNGEKSEGLSSYISYDLNKKIWKEEGDILINGKQKVLMGASAEALGSMHILVYGGSDEILFDKLENYTLQLASKPNDSIVNKIISDRNELLNKHPGFSKEIIAYNTVTKKWFVDETVTTKIPVTALSFSTKNGFIIVSGEISPGIRTPKVQQYIVADAAEPFGTVNYIVLAAYLLISLLIGVYFASKQKSTDDYFVGGGRIPWWAAGLSVFGTLLSAITFMAIPAKAFLTDWSYFVLNMAAILITPVIAFVFIPFFNKLKISTAYEYLEDRFNYTARAFGSLSFILFQLGRIGIVLLLPSLAISIVTGIPVDTSIMIMGVLCILYTTFGGIEAVIWTDVLQVVVLLGGSVLAVIWILLHTEMPFGEMVTYASEHNKFNMDNFDFNFTDTTFWVVLIGGLASALVTQGTDQTIVQRYLTSTDVKDSQKTLYTNAVLTLPASIIFFGIGTLLFIFYTEMPEKLSPAISNNDSIFPWYIVRELPVGVSGLLVAGIFSAAMSSISSSLNSVSTAYCNDFHKHYRPKTADKKLLKIARLATITTGVLGMIFALWMASSDIKSLWDQFYKVLGLFTGGLGGMFLLGMLTKKANSTGTLIGLVISAFVIFYISNYTEISFLMYAFFGLASCFVFGYIFSLVFREKNK
ncbi:sodium/solute symporter [Aureibaculum algae]|uniref:Sodium/solute symporter n=1 Tax=Aureibaculum algae TaxID=2584122 RepID=A0A5B7TU07_9FLAO|nr:sodium/solute symporter [Aureibaculum algae]QCX38606.1 sodium/solute symporter [Aureibaculum algae]